MAKNTEWGFYRGKSPAEREVDRQSSRDYRQATKDERAMARGFRKLWDECDIQDADEWLYSLRNRAELLATLDEDDSREVQVPKASGVVYIAAERARQKSREGYTDAHDDTHGQCEMVLAAVAYALHAAGPWDTTQYWPFHPSEWKPSDPVHDLVRAGALIAAEIDRLQRMVGSATEPPSAERADPRRSEAPKSSSLPPAVGHEE